MGPDYFEGVLAAFEASPRLGIASGTAFEEFNGTWRELTLLGDHCHVSTRTYRRGCLEEVLPLDDGVGYSVIDEAKARLAGYEVRTLYDLPYRHHRREGTGEGSPWQNWYNQGRAAQYLSYRPSYLLARCLFRIPAEPVIGMIFGYTRSVLGRGPRYEDHDVIELRAGAAAST